MTTDLLENIEAYLDGNLSREALEKMASEQEEHINLDEEIEWYKQSRVAIEATGLRAQLADVLPKEEKKEAKVIPFRRRLGVLSVAASILLLVVAYFGFMRGGSQSLYAQYEFEDPGLPVLMSQSDQFELYDAMTYYSEGKYDVAEEKLQTLAEGNMPTDTVLYYLGASKLYQGKSTEAVVQFEKVIAQQSGVYQEKAEWLRILSLLRAKQLEEVEPFVKEVADNNAHPFAVQARQLLTDLNNE